MANRNLLWSELRALNELYETGETTSSILKSGFIRKLKSDKKLIDLKLGNNKKIISRNGFVAYYKAHLKESFSNYLSFLNANDLYDDGRRNYDEYDMATLLFIHRNKEEFKKGLTTIRHFSADVFKGKGSKYLEGKESVRKAVCKILGIEDFPDKDPSNHQWRLVVDCLRPKAVVLCENMANLKMPDRPRANGVELWFVGGNNVNIIHHISEDKLQLPLYYSGDWDYDGLQIYSRVKKLLHDKEKKISLLFPYETKNSLPINSPNHNSKWLRSKSLSGLEASDFTRQEKKLITDLINKNHWIEEESLDFIMNLHHNQILQMAWPLVDTRIKDGLNSI